MPPTLLAGARTNSLDDAAPLDPVALRAAPGPAPGLPALHLVAEAADARSPLRVSRTYFLSQGVLTHNHFAGDEGRAGWQGGTACDTKGVLTHNRFAEKKGGDMHINTGVRVGA